jgi:protein SCO1/2
MTTTPLVQRTLLLVLIALVVGIGVVLLTQGSNSASSPTHSSRFDGPTMPPGLRAADFTLTDQNGRTVSLSRLRGRVVVLTFIHSLCHDACPLMVEQIKGALNELPRSGQGVPAIGITVAPAEDTAGNRRKFLASHEMNSRMAFLNGPLAAVRQVWHAYAIQPGAAPGAHSAFVLLIDKRGLERVGFAADQLTPEELAHDIRVLEAERA